MENIGVDAAKLAGLQIDLLQKIRDKQINIEHLEWFNMLKKSERDNLVAGNGFVKQDDRFDYLKTIDLVVPGDYNHATRLALFREEKYKNFCGYNDDITDKNYAGVTSRLVAGQKGKVKIFQIKKGVSSSDCLKKLKEEKAILVGAQGASLVWELKKEKLPVGKWSVSFDEKEALWQDGNGRRRVPSIRRGSNDWYFNLGNFENGWFDDYCLLCFCDFN
jgi:hypothetical protein